jgi:DNA polymerase-3 subunit alpha
MEETKPQNNFVHLHAHSTYSFQDALGLPEQYAKRVSEIGQPAMAITDHGNISAHYKWYKQMNKVGVKPILGCEFYIVINSMYLREPTYNHITVLAQNEIGYKNLTKLVTKAWCEQFYYKPKISLDDLEQYKEGLIVLSGCISGMPAKKIINGKKEDAEELILRMSKSFGDNFYVEIMPIRFAEGTKAYLGLIDIAQRNNLPMVATMDCHYIYPEQHNLHEILICLRDKNTMDNPDRFKYDQDDFYLKTREEMDRDLKECFPGIDFTEALDNTVKIAQKCDFKFHVAKPLSFPIEDALKPDKLRELCEKGMIDRGFDTNHPKHKEYRERMEYEFDLIVKKNFVDYFLVISDLIIWAKNKGILVGPGRGSAAGSLICYLTEITEVDPIEFDLIFERFIDINREDLPDIDIDFEDSRRHEIKDYLSDKYGKHRVGNLPTFAFFKSKNCIDDIGRVFKIPFKVLEEIKKLVVERSGGDSRASFTLEDTFSNPLFEYPKKAMEQYPELKYTIQLEGQIRQMGQHAAGFVVANEDITDFCAIYKIKDEYVLSMDYKDVTSIGLLKIDLLGLNTLSVISKTTKLVEERTGEKIDMYKMKFEDPKVYQGFIKEKLFGIFQFDGQAVNQISRQIKPDNFTALYDISALARPGPLNGGSTNSYIQRRAGKERIEYPHPLMELYTKDTYGVVIYQEQVMRTMREVGKMSWKDTAEIRRLISKSQGVEKFNTFKASFTVGALENGLTIPEIDKMWNAICTMGSWSFNKSHCVSYSMISYWTMYLKVYHPMEFYSSILSLVNDDDKKKKIIKEYKKEGYKILSVDVNRSKKNFSIDGSGIRIGFNDVKGIGETASENIIKKQPYLSYKDFKNKTSGKRITEGICRSLIEIGAFDSIPQSENLDLFGGVATFYVKNGLDFNSRFLLCPWDMEFNIKTKWRQFYIDHKEELFNTFPTPIEHLKEMEGSTDVVIWGIVYDKNLRDKKEAALSKNKKNTEFTATCKNCSNKEKLSVEQINDIKNYKCHKCKSIGAWDEEPTMFCNFIIEDDTDFMTARISPKLFPVYGNMIFEQVKGDDVVVMKGKMGSGIRMFFANAIISLSQLNSKYQGKESDIGLLEYINKNKIK